MSRLVIIVMVLSIMAIASFIIAIIYNWAVYKKQSKKSGMPNKYTLEDIMFMKKILPKHYAVKAIGDRGDINCMSNIGIRKSPYQAKDGRGRTIIVNDAEDDEHWEYIFKAIKKYFGNRFQEVNHTVCFCHTDFTVRLK